MTYPLDASFFAPYYVPFNFESGGFPGFVVDPKGSTADGTRWYPFGNGPCEDYTFGSSEYTCVVPPANGFPSLGVHREWPETWGMPFLFKSFNSTPTGPSTTPASSTTSVKIRSRPSSAYRPSCFMIHQIGMHTNSGNMWPYYVPL